MITKELLVLLSKITLSFFILTFIISTVVQLLQAHQERLYFLLIGSIGMTALSSLALSLAFVWYL